jgi:hypothetical protein
MSNSKFQSLFSCRDMVWEPTIRILADSLNGDAYYKINYP